MSFSNLQSAVETAWDNRDGLSPSSKGEGVDAVRETIALLDSGTLRTAEKSGNGDWVAAEWVKKAVLLGFRIQGLEIASGGPQAGNWWDKVDSKFKGWGQDEFSSAGFRAVPNCVVRKGSYIAKNVVLMRYWRRVRAAPSQPDHH